MMAPGAVWRLDSEHIAHMGRKPGRPVIIVEVAERAQDESLLYVLVVPCTTKDEVFQDERTVTIPRGTAGLPYDSHALIYLVQPVEKHLLREYIGTLPEELIWDIAADLYDLLNIIPR